MAYIEQYKNQFDVFLWIEHRMKGEEAEQQSNKLARNNLMKAVDEARDTEDSASEEDKTHKSSGVFNAIDCALPSVVDLEEQ